MCTGKDKCKISVETSLCHIKFLHQLSFKNINLKVDYHKSVVHPGPQTLQGESIA